MTTRIMNRLLGAVAVGLAIAGSDIAADASVRLPAEQMNGMPSLAPLLNQIKAAVVRVTITGRLGPEKNSRQSLGRAANPRDLPAAPQVRAAGSGVIIDAQKGLIFTNNHVINGADDIIVTLAEGREVPAKRVSSDPGTDIAVIKVQAENLTALPIGDSDGLEVGDFVLTIGNPYRIGQTVTSGIISGLHRTNVGIEEYEDFIQTDAAIYHARIGVGRANESGIDADEFAAEINKRSP